MDRFLRNKKAAQDAKPAPEEEDEDFEIVDEEASDEDKEESAEEDSNNSSEDDSSEDDSSDEEAGSSSFLHQEEPEENGDTKDGEEQERDGEEEEEDDQTEGGEQDKLAKVQVKFSTKLEGQFDVPTTPFFVPVNLSRLGLSTVLNHILSLERPQPFDFLIKDEFLRVPLNKYLKKHNLSPDDALLEIEFTLALTLPKKRDQITHEDWVSCVHHTLLTGTNQEVAYTGSYDGFVRLWDLDRVSSQDENSKLETIGTFRCHTKPIKAIAIVQDPESTNRYPDVLTTALDQKLLLWNTKMMRSKEDPSKRVLKMLQRAEFVGQIGQIESISLSPSKQQFCAAGWDQKVHFWELNELEDVTHTTPSALEPEAKRPKRNVPRVSSVHSLSGHTDRISSVCWYSSRSCISASWDNTIRVWDIPSSISTSIIRGKKPIHCMDFNKSNGLIVTGHVDFLLRLWDPRSKEGELVRQQFRSHKGVVSHVKWNPENEVQFASASLDNTVRVWDTRSPLPLFTLRSHADKVLCVEWDVLGGKERLLSGSADRELHLHLFKGPQSNA